MLNNLVNAADASAFVRRATRTPRWLLTRFSSDADRRAREAWAHTAGDPIHWYDIPAIRARQNRLVSGDPEVSYVDYICGAHFEGRSGLDAVSLGCGMGSKELAWARTGIFRRLRGYDFAGPRIAFANARAEEAGLAEVVEFAEADVYALDIEPGSLDLVLFDDSLHHFKPVRGILERVRGWLRPDGTLVVREFVGPRAFQWPARHVAAANGMLAVLPPRLRTDYATGRIRTRIVRPSRLRMRLVDPSEAVESDLIVDAVHDLFSVVEEFPLGGTLVHLVVADIAHHFTGDDPEAARFLELMFQAEDSLLAAGDLPSDHMLMIARPPS